MHRVRFAVLLLCTCVLSVLNGQDARANMAKWWTDGEAHGPLVPQDDTSIRVDSEDLSFVVAPSLDSAEVTATYRMTNGGAAATRAEVAFVMVASENARDGREAARATVTIDGVPVPGRLVTEADVLGPALDAWLARNPDAARELARLKALPLNPKYTEAAVLRGYAPGCRDECLELLAWYSEKQNPEQHISDESRRQLVFHAAAEAIPSEVAALQHGWSKLKVGRPLSWLTFPLEIAAGASRTVTVRYTHAAGSDTSHAVNTVFTYEYLLSPARRWARFGELHVTLQLPPGTSLRAPSLSFTEEGATYRANLPGLPSSELTFEVMSRKGLLFGMTQPSDYWLLVLAAMSLVTIPLAACLGRVWARSKTRLAKVLACVFGTGFAALVWNGLVVAAVSTVFPQRAFGHDYGAGFGLVGSVALFALAAIAISLVALRARQPD